MRLHVNGYTRVSTEEQAASGVSLESQRKKIGLYCRLHNHELGELIEDAGVSGKSLDRPGLSRARARLDSGQAEGLVIAKLDRLTRSVVDWNELIGRHFGVGPGRQLFSVADSIDTRTAAGRMVLNVLMSVAQCERETNVERTRDALDHKRARGERTGGVPIGKALDPADPRRSKSGQAAALVPCPAELEALAVIRRLAAEGWTIRAIGAELGRLGFEPKLSSRGWAPSVVHKVVAEMRDRERAEATEI